MSEIYKEAILEAKKLRQVAEEDAKNKIIEKISPYIKKMIKVDSLTEQTDLELPEIEDEPVEGETQDAGLDLSLPTDAELGDQITDAPVEPAGEPEFAVVDDTINAALPDEEGMITVDFNDLFQQTGNDATATVAPIDQEIVGDETQSVEEEEPTLELGESARSYTQLKNKLNEAHSFIDRVFFAKKRTPGIVKESIKSRLFNLLEQNDRLLERGVITREQARLNEKKLEFMYLKLKESEKLHTYSKINEANTIMKLKNIAAKLFEEDENLARDSVSTGETGLPVDDEYSKHAKEESGMSTELDDFLREELNTADANTNANDDVAKGAAGFGDTDEDPTVEFEVEGLCVSESRKRKLRKESIRRKLAKLREASAAKKLDSWEDAEPEGGADPTHVNLKEEFDMEDNMDLGDDASLVVKVDLPDEVEELLAGFGDSDVSADVELVGAFEDLDDDDTIVVVDDEDEILADEGMIESRRRSRKSRIAENRRGRSRGRGRSESRQLREAKALLVRARNALQKNLKENNALKAQLKEANLFTAKTVYLNKLLMREGLSKKAIRQIVEHLDNTKTIAEARAVYNKIQTRLNESTSKKRMVGSSSRVTRSGSALTESVSPARKSAGDDNVNRWQVIAGIRKKS